MDGVTLKAKAMSGKETPPRKNQKLHRIGTRESTERK
jgi:hypothetical protein